MKKLLLILALAFIGLFHEELCGENRPNEPGYCLGGLSTSEIDSLYRNIRAIGQKPSFPLFSNGLIGYCSLLKEGEIQNSRYLTLIDFTLSSKERRLWVIDLENDSILHYSLVAHGKNTGEEYAVKFSNKPKSNMSSLGVFVTGSTYYGKHGLSLLLEGVEKGINDNARKRAIVIHPASYATHDFVRKYGRLGRSFGCPALPPSKSADIIETIKGGSCFYIYHPDRKHLLATRYLAPD